MAIANKGAIISPSNDIKTKEELNSIRIPSGLYYCTEDCTIVYTKADGKNYSLQSDLWAVTCLSDKNLNNLKCYMQIWVCVACQTNDMFIRTLTKDGLGFTDFSKVVNTEMLREQAVVNTHSEPVHVVVSNTQPTAESGITKIWIDTSGN